MSETAPNHVLSRYLSISNKLKKRLFRKPNVQEACDQYSSLGLHCEIQNLPHYAGMCWQAVARCESEVGHSNEEVTALLRAGKNYLQAESNNEAFGPLSLGEENFQTALYLDLTTFDDVFNTFLCPQSGVHCYCQASSRLEKQGLLGVPQSAAIALKLGSELQKKCACQAQTQYKKAAELQRLSPLGRLEALGLIASSKIEEGDFDGALLLFTEMAAKARNYGPQPPSGVYADIMHRCEVSQLLLLLLLQPTPHRLPQMLSTLLEKYTWGEQHNASVDLLNEELSLLLQSLVLACQSQDASALCVVESDLWPHLSAEQKHLLRALVSSASHKVH